MNARSYLTSDRNHSRSFRPSKRLSNRKLLHRQARQRKRRARRIARRLPGSRRLTLRQQTFLPRDLAPHLDQHQLQAALESRRIEARRVRLFPPLVTCVLLLTASLYRHLSKQNFLAKVARFPVFKRFWNGQTPSDSAFCAARARLGFRVIRDLFQSLSKRYLSETRGRYVGDRRVFAVDGVKPRLAYSEKNDKAFGRHKSTELASHPQLLVLALVDVASHLVLGACWAPHRRSETKLFRKLVPSIPEGSVLLMDSAYTGYEIWQRLLDRKVDFVVRASGKINSHAKVEKSLGSGDELVTLNPNRHARKLNPNLKPELTMRRIRVKTRSGLFHLLTTLLDPSSISAGSLRQLYKERYEIELVFDEIKTHLQGCHWVNRPELFNEREPHRVIQALWALLLTYNVLRRGLCRVMREGGYNGFGRKLSFAKHLEEVREGVSLGAWLSGGKWRGYVEDRDKGLLKAKVKRRAGRTNPRQVNVRVSKYPKKPPRPTFKRHRRYES